MRMIYSVRKAYTVTQYGRCVCIGLRGGTRHIVWLGKLISRVTLGSFNKCRLTLRQGLLYYSIESKVNLSSRCLVLCALLGKERGYERKSLVVATSLIN